MENKMSYDDKLELDSLVAEVTAFHNNFYQWDIYSVVLEEISRQLLGNLENYSFSKVITCIKKLLKNIPSTENAHSSICEEIEAIMAFMDKIKDCCEDLIKKGFDNYNEEEIELTEKDKMKLQKQKADFRLKEIQEENAPYLNLSLSIVFILMSVIFVFIPDYFNNSTLLYHICGFMFFFGFLFAKQEIELRNKIGFITQSEKLTNKRAFISLVQAVVYMIPLAVLSIFFYELLFIRILLFVQIWFCAVLLINGILILSVHSYKNKKMEKFSIWGFILGAISIIGFVIQILQLFKII